nr:MAG TPA: hypothetical protein [Caudoviricetes sp.]
MSHCQTATPPILDIFYRYIYHFIYIYIFSKYRGIGEHVSVTV